MSLLLYHLWATPYQRVQWPLLRSSRVRSLYPGALNVGFEIDLHQCVVFLIEICCVQRHQNTELEFYNAVQGMLCGKMMFCCK